MSTVVPERTHAIELTESEVLVLHEFVARVSDDPSIVPDGSAEWYALNALECLFERVNDVVFLPNHGERLEKARRNVQALRGTNRSGSP